MQDGTNPLLHLGFDIPFDEIRAEHVRPGIRALLDRAKAAVAAIPKGPLTYDGVLLALERAHEDLDLAMTIVGHLESVATTPELRDAYNEVKPDVSAFYASLPLDGALWARLVELSKTGEAKALTGARKRFLEKTIDDFRRHGAELDAGGKKRLETITRELATLTAKYGQNVLDETAAWELVIEDAGALEGLPESAKAAAKESAEKKGKAGYRFTLQGPSVVPVLTYLDDRSIREKVYRAYNARAAAGERNNAPLIARILELRKEEAALLAFRDFADLVLDDRMAKTGAKARAFVEALAARTRPFFNGEQRELAAFRAKLEGSGAPDMMPWDVAYYAEKQRQALYDFDEEELRPYFSAERAVEGVFATASKLYGVAIEPIARPGWHPDVKAYAIRDGDGTMLGAFYVDLYPREEKRGGAWMNGLISGVWDGARREPHLGLICSNVMPPVGDTPALLSHDDVTTLFHEFGHLLHHLLSKVAVRSLAGTNVAWDFVELPSQIMENWCWEREALDLFARHHETGDRIPDELFAKMKRARTYREASAMMRQLGFASVDMALHTAYVPERDGDVVAYARRIMQAFAPAPYTDDYAFICSFNHLFSSAVGYAAGYYSYKWAEVLDADAFTRFKERGVFSREVGMAFRTAILEKGDGEDPMALYLAFMGREPSLDALLERSGLS
jgi:oligopeptidase A